MPGEASDLPGPGDPTLPSEPTFEREVLTPGRHTNAFLDENPRLRKVTEAYPEVFIANPDQPKAIMTLAGFQEAHPGILLRDFGPLLGYRLKEINSTLVVVNWTKLTDIPDLRWRALADYLEEKYPQGANLFGTSYGGYEILNGLTILNKLAEEENFAVPFKSAAIVVAPASGESLRPKGFTRVLSMLTLLEGGLGRTSVLLLPKTLRSDIVRIRHLKLKEGFRQGDFPKGVKVDYFGTDPAGILDPVVDQPRAIEELKSAGVEVEPHWYNPDPKIAHYPAPEEAPRLMEDVFDVFKQADRAK